MPVQPGGQHETITRQIHRLDPTARWLSQAADHFSQHGRGRDGSSLTLVDSGLPEHWAAIKSSCGVLGLDVYAIEAELLTHVHSDYAGSAERARVEAAATIRWHPDDAELADGRTYRRNERPVAAYLWRPAAVAAMWELIAGGACARPG